MLCHVVAVFPVVLFGQLEKRQEPGELARNINFFLFFELLHFLLPFSPCPFLPPVHQVHVSCPCIILLLGVLVPFAVLLFLIHLYSTMHRAISASSRSSLLSAAGSSRGQLSKLRPAGVSLQQQRFAHKVCLFRRNWRLIRSKGLPVGSSANHQIRISNSASKVVLLY